jgi:hypothetical protein
MNKTHCSNSQSLQIMFEADGPDSRDGSDEMKKYTIVWQ